MPPRNPNNPRAVGQVLAAVEAAAAVAPLNQTVSATPTQAQVQAISTKVDALIAALSTALAGSYE